MYIQAEALLARNFGASYAMALTIVADDGNIRLSGTPACVSSFLA